MERAESAVRRPEAQGSQRVVRLAKRPVGAPAPGADLVLGLAARPTSGALSDGQVLVRNEFLALDPAMRGWMREQKSYLPPVALGAVMRGSSVGRVVATRGECGGLRAGDWVNCGLVVGWAEWGVCDARELRKIEVSDAMPASVHLGALGGTGLTAYFGLLDVGRPQAGETVVVSAAAGATGSMVCQIARLKGCRVVGVAGGADKCRWVREELGAHAVIDYKAAGAGAGGFRKALREAAPDGVDIFFDNVGGWQLDAVLKALNFNARVVLCGAISGYNETSLQAGPASYLNLISTSSRMEGFILLNYASRYEEAYAHIAAWIAAGQVKYSEERVPGLALAPQALLRLFGAEGGNKGRLIVDIHADSADRSDAARL
jgi:NADPH-dependent curcumin reductase CurA